MSHLTAHDQVRIAAVAGRAPRTVARVYAGHACESTTRASVESAAKQLGLPPPPPADDTAGEKAAG